MAMDMCSHCGSWKDLDWEDGYYIVNGEYWCTDCCMDELPEDVLDLLWEEGEVTILEPDPPEFKTYPVLTRRIKPAETA